jgi:MFS family permease
MSASGTTRPSLWRHADFMKVWAAATVSLFGTSISQVAIPVIAVLVLHASPFEFALIATIEFLPWLLFTLPAGVWVDRLPRRRILIASDVGRAVMLLTIPVATALNGLTIYQLYVIGFLNGVLTVFFDVADQSYLPTVIERNQLVEGNSKLQLSSSSAQLLGQPAGGAVVALLTAPFAVILDAISYIASAFLLLGIRRQEPRVEAGTMGEKRPGMRAEIAEGLRYIFGNPMLSKIAGATGSSNLFSNISFAVIPLYLLQEVGLSVPAYGALGGFYGGGVLLGALVADRIPRAIGVGRTILWSIALGGPAGLLVPLAPRDLVFPFVAASFFINGISNVVYNVNQVSLRQAITPERMLGRLNGTMRFLVWGTMPIGSVIGGVLAQFLGVHTGILIGAILGLFPFISILFSPVPSLKTIPEPVAEPGGPERGSKEPGSADAAEAQPRRIPGAAAPDAGPPLEAVLEGEIEADARPDRRGG